jgi:predicted AlkP superfamily pyrophosphatase or phosphodiesterase
MRRVVLAVAVLVAAVAGLRGQETSRLLVVVMVDQMRADYLVRFDAHWSAGFRTLLDEGLHFESARYPYYNTWTCTGHATVSTGTLPRTHGMISNAWWDRDIGRSVACTDDPDAPAVPYRAPEPAEEDEEDAPEDGEAPRPTGYSARRLLAPTLGDELRARTPGARVVTLSLKARSAIGLAGRGGDAVSWFDGGARGFVTSQAYARTPVPDVLRFIEDHPIERDNGRRWTLIAPAASYRHRDAGVGENPIRGWTGLFPHQVEGREGADAQFYTRWEYSPFADAYVGEMAAALVERLALGQRGTTDFLGVSFSVLDNVGHTFGPDSREVEDVLRRLDVTLGALIDALDEHVGRERYRLALTADHGVPPISTAVRAGTIASSDVRDRVEIALVEAFGALDEGAYVLSAGSGEIVLAPGVFDRLAARPDVFATIERDVTDIPGVDRVLRADELIVESQDPVIRAVALGHVTGRSGDLVVVTEPNWYFGGDGTTHGSLHDYDRHVPLIFLGGGIRAGRDASPVSPADIAPTLATFGDVRMPEAEGRVLVD